MWDYERKLMYPVKIKNPNPKLAKYVISQYGGPDGELAASLRYLSQKYTMPTNAAKGLLNDIGTEELAHLEMVGAIVYQLTRDIDSQIVKDSGFGEYFINHSTGVYPANSNGMPFDALALAVTGDPITDLTENMAAEQKARSTYDNILRMSDDPDVNDVIRFLRQREIVHFQRFGEMRNKINEMVTSKNKFFMGK
jgi:spore coat protein JC